MGELKNVPVLFGKKEDCCGCGACLNICPKHAISMKEDECGFIYPEIDEEKCIVCGQCKKVCAFKNVEVKNSSIMCYAAISRNKEQRKKSASAGIFAAIATKVIEDDGIVYGAAFDERLRVHHISAETIEELCALQGSKYVHSDTERTYSGVKEQLTTGRKVLFSGTPCQVAGLQGYLGREYANLLTIDIVCHGVPSNKMFQEYIQTLEEKYCGKVESFTFRDKSIGWGINGSAMINGKKKKIWHSASSYLYYFTKGWIYRDNCYKCPYACEHRPADITLGDYWGIEKQHSDYLKDKNWNPEEGISALIISTKNGIEMLNDLSDYIEIRNSEFGKIREGNAQLSAPSKKEYRDNYIIDFNENGWLGIDEKFNAKIGIKKYQSMIKNIIPPRLRHIIKSIV